MTRWLSFSALKLYFARISPVWGSLSSYIIALFPMPVTFDFISRPSGVTNK